ncbi:hypothetical protein [Aquimarina aquimarini]|nr:hypothetical protein [Aquimarina aquimarini]
MIEKKSNLTFFFSKKNELITIPPIKIAETIKGNGNGKKKAKM